MIKRIQSHMDAHALWRRWRSLVAFVSVNALFTAVGLDLSVSFPVPPVRTIATTNCDSSDDNASK